MKKSICFLLIAAVIACMLAGCAPQKKPSVFEADNEIVTYQKVDPEKTQLIVSRTGNIPVELVCSAFEKINPDIQIIYIDITGGTSHYSPLRDWIDHGDLPDIVISASDFRIINQIDTKFVDLSDNLILKEYNAAALQRTAVDARVYWLPGPSDISAMMYNKTLFDKYGWEVPAAFDEFIALCDRIRADTNGEVEAWNPNAKYGNELLTAIEAMTYAEMLGGLENRTWYDKLLDGKAVFSGHMEPYTDVLQTLIDHDILREEHFSYSATTRGKEFSGGKIAMINGNIFDGDNDEFDFELMPFPTTKGEIGYLCDSFSCFVGVPIKQHTDKENDAIARFLTYFSSPEGQAAYIGKALKISNIKNAPVNQSNDLVPLQPAVDEGHMFERMDFYSNSKKCSMVSLHDLALSMVIDGVTGKEALERIDARLAEINNGTAAKDEQEVTTEVVASAAEDFTILETSFFMADTYREKADADIGLITNNEAYRGNLMRIYAGDIVDKEVTVLKPRSFANDSTLVKVSMTGRQFVDALNNPVGNDKTADCIYAYSGLKCEVAPWNELGSKYISIKLADGSELQPDKLYTVAVWAGTVADEYISETLESYEGSWEEMMTEKLKKDGTISPAADNRIKLVWN